MLNNIVKGVTADLNDFILVLGMIFILLVLFTPIPAYLLDVLLLVNIAASLLVLLTTFYSEKPLEFSTFPSLLLMTTLFRLALNISATRLILADADAGKLISAIGEYVVGGNYVIGLVVFLILIVVQYVVVTNGAQRVAEVAARFTLDSLPGKQMSVDADLNMGIIDHEEAKKRRKQLEKESNFYGAMDGASKFVKGDAVAGIIIIIIDIVAGLAIGIAQKEMSWGTALHRYTLLTVGDGIVTQIPSLVIAIAAGIMITRAATDDSRLGEEMVRQFSLKPKAILLAGLAIFAFVLFPGMPALPVLLVSAIFLLFSWLAYRKSAAHEEVESAQDGHPKMEGEESERLYQDMACPPLELLVTPELRSFLERDATGFEKRLAVLRKKMAKQLGLVLPPMSVRKDSSMEAGSYQLYIYGERVARGSVRIERLLAIKPNGETVDVEGEETQDPSFGLPAKWITQERRKLASHLGYTLVEPELVLLTHIQEAIKSFAGKFLTRNYVEELLNKRKTEIGSAVEELVPAHLSYSDLQKILQCLLNEQVSIRNLLVIFDVIVDQARYLKKPEELAERCREALRNTICENLADPQGKLNVITLSAELERKMSSVLNGNDTAMPLAPYEFEQFLTRVIAESEKLIHKNLSPVLVCSGAVRRYLKKLVGKAVPQLAVLSVTEIDERYTVVSAGNISLGK